MRIREAHAPPLPRPQPALLRAAPGADGAEHRRHRAGRDRLPQHRHRQPQRARVVPRLGRHRRGQGRPGGDRRRPALRRARLIPSSTTIPTSSPPPRPSRRSRAWSIIPASTCRCSASTSFPTARCAPSPCTTRRAARPTWSSSCATRRSSPSRASSSTGCSLKIGDPIRVATQTGPKTFRLGFILDFGEDAPGADEHLSVMDIANVQENFLHAGKLSRISALLRPGADFATVADRLRRELAARHGGAGARPPQPPDRAHARRVPAQPHRAFARLAARRDVPYL